MLASLLQKGLDLKVTCGRAWKVLGPFKMRGGIKAHYIKQLEAHPLGKGGLEKYVHYQERNKKAVLHFRKKSSFIIQNYIRTLIGMIRETLS